MQMAFPVVSLIGKCCQQNCGNLTGLTETIYMGNSRSHRNAASTVIVSHVFSLFREQSASKSIQMGHRDNSAVVELEVSAQEVRGTETMIKGIAAAALYGVCSVSSAFVTKTLLDTLHFDFPVTIMAVQMVFSIVVLETLSCLGVITLPAYTLKRGLSFAWPALFYGVNAVLALTALAHMNIAMYGVLKRCVPISTLILSTVVLRQGWPSRGTMATVCMLSIGCIVAGE